MVGVGGGRHVEVVVVHLDGSVQILLAQIQKSTGDAVRPNHPHSFLGLLDLLDLLNQDSPWLRRSRTVSYTHLTLPTIYSV